MFHLYLGMVSLTENMKTIFFKLKFKLNGNIFFDALIKGKRVSNIMIFSCTEKNDIH